MPIQFWREADLINQTPFSKP